MNVYDILSIPRPEKPPKVELSQKTSSQHRGKRRNKRTSLKGGDVGEMSEEPDAQGEQPSDKTSITASSDASQNDNRNDNRNVSQSSVSQRDVTSQNLTKHTTIEKYDPKTSRPTMSIYEYAEAHTKLAEFIEKGKSVKQFTDDVEIKGNVNPTELAFHLLKEGKWDGTIDRGYDVVTYSRLEINPQWEEEVQNYFNAQHDIQRNDLFKPLGLI